VIRSKVISTVALVALFLVPVSVNAAPQPVEVPSGVGPLPDISTGPVVVDNDGVRLYRAVLPEPLFDLVAQGEFVFSAVKTPQFVERFSDAPVAGEQSHRVSDSGAIAPAPRNPRGPLFAQQGAGGGGEPQSAGVAERVYKTLWNSTSSLWRHGYAKADLSLVIFKESIATGRQVRWRIERIYPAALGSYPGTLQPLFREKISAVLPAVLEGLRWLTIRSVGSTDDYVWVASPITGGVRQMTGSNRADDLFSGAFSPDDLFVWSGKVELVQPQRVSSQVLLVPFVSRPLGRTSGDGVCENRSPQPGPLLELNHASRRFPQARGWVPTNAMMAPRRVTQVDLSSRDPLSPDVAVSLFFDEEAGLPVYKIVWGRNGRVRSFVIGIIGAFSVGSNFQPLPLAQVVVHPHSSERSVMTVDTLTTCKALPAGVSYNDFDPAGLGSKVATQEAVPAAPAAHADPIEEEEPND
jgi:hypothetical protein